MTVIQTVITSFTGIREGRRTVEASFTRDVDQVLDISTCCADSGEDRCIVGGTLWEDGGKVDDQITLFEGTRAACIQWVAAFQADPDKPIEYESID